MGTATYVEGLVNEVRALLDHIIETFERLELEAVTDFGTGVFNRRYFLRRLSEEFQRSQRYGTPFSLIILDFDDFKRYNDRHGHLEGDDLLRSYARVMEESLRKPDFVARYGGDEFVIVLPGTQEKGAIQVTDRLRARVATFDNDAPTLSMGVVTFPTHGETWQELIRRADAALYVAKSLGKNMAVSGSDSRVASVLEDHYDSASLLGARSDALPHLGGGTPIDRPPVARPHDAALNAPRSDTSISHDIPQNDNPSRVPKNPPIHGVRKNRGQRIVTPLRSIPVNGAYNASRPIAMAYTSSREQPAGYWLDGEFHPIQALRSADIVSATGLDTYFSIETPAGHRIVRRRGTRWFLEAGETTEDFAGHDRHPA